MSRFRAHRFSHRDVVSSPPDRLVATSSAAHPRTGAGVDDHLRFIFDDGTRTGLHVRRCCGSTTVDVDSRSNLSSDMGLAADEPDHARRHHRTGRRSPPGDAHRIRPSCSASIPAWRSHERRSSPGPDPALHRFDRPSPRRVVMVPLSADRLPVDAPNVVLILLDDAGFGTCSTRWPVPTPTVDRVARAGLRYQFHHGALLCAASYGRNHHRGQGGITEIPQFPGYDSAIPERPPRLPRSCAGMATAPERSGDSPPGEGLAGRSTGGRPAWGSTFYGIIGAEASHWNRRSTTRPSRRTSPRPRRLPRPRPRRQAITWINDSRPQRPSPVLLLQAAARPHHVAPDWIERFGALRRGLGPTSPRHLRAPTAPG